MTGLKKFWYSLNYRYCKVQEYLASHRGDGEAVGHWNSKAYQWETKYLMVGKDLYE